jgi:hypothetical protein
MLLCLSQATTFIPIIVIVLVSWCLYCHWWYLIGNPRHTTITQHSSSILVSLRKGYETIKYPFHILQITSTKKKNFKEYFFHIFQVSDSPRVFRFPPLIKLTPQYKWNIVESGIKHHNPNHYSYFLKEQIVSLIYKFSEGFCLFLYLCECFFNHTGKKGAFCNYIQSGVFFF